MKRIALVAEELPEYPGKGGRFELDGSWDVSRWNGVSKQMILRSKNSFLETVEIFGQTVGHVNIQIYCRYDQIDKFSRYLLNMIGENACNSKYGSFCTYSSLEVKKIFKILRENNEFPEHVFLFLKRSIETNDWRQAEREIPEFTEFQASSSPASTSPSIVSSSRPEQKS